MAQEIELFMKCTQCNGTGVFQSAHGPDSGSMPCNWPGCNGTGFISKGKFVIDPGNDDVVDKCEDIFEKCEEILAKLNE